MLPDYSANEKVFAYRVIRLLFVQTSSSEATSVTMRQGRAPDSHHHHKTFTSRGKSFEEGHKWSHNSFGLLIFM